jgi:hypothetical protein
LHIDDIEKANLAGLVLIGQQFHRDARGLHRRILCCRGVAQ